MHKYMNKIYVICMSCFLCVGLLFGMFVIQIPITKSFESVAEKIGDEYYRVRIPADASFNIISEKMYISLNKNETVLKVEIELDNEYIFFCNNDVQYAESYDQRYSYEIITGSVNLLECIFLRGGRTIE